jgi:beta-glucosidase
MTTLEKKLKLFPPTFQWGVASSAYQVEGAVTEDGNGPSIWDLFSHTPGKTSQGENGDIACDHYHRYSEDLSLMKNLGVTHYRFSVSWPRIFPDGRQRMNVKGLGFYDRMVDTLLSHNITPIITLYHWDLPLALQEQGGWQNRDTAHAFADYAETMVSALGDRVKQWITHNEPWCTAYLGHFSGEHAPGIKNAQAAVDAAHYVLLSHALSTMAMRATQSDA